MITVTWRGECVGVWVSVSVCVCVCVCVCVRVCVCVVHVYATLGIRFRAAVIKIRDGLLANGYPSFTLEDFHDNVSRNNQFY